MPCNAVRLCALELLGVEINHDHKLNNMVVVYKVVDAHHV